MRDKSVLLLGDHQQRDFREAVCWLGQYTRLTQVTTSAEALERLAGEVHHDAIVIAQSRPGQFSTRLVEALHVASPLSRLVGLMGSWCEGEMRTGRPWPGVIRIMWHQWKPRLIPQLLADPDVQPETWSLPRTASVAEQMSAAAQAVWPPQQGLISIHTHAFRDFRAVSDACSHVGYSTVWCSPAQPLHASGVEAAVFDGVAAGRPTLALLTEIAQQVHPAPVVALLDYVRRQDYDQALAAGAAAVVAKPLLTFDLLWHLNDLIESPPAKQAPHAQSGVTSAA